MLKRKLLQELLEWKESRYTEAIMVTGARQVGKTFLINNFIKNNFEHHIRIDFVTDPDMRDIFSKKLDVDSILFELSLRVKDFKAEPNKTIIFLDEIQLCPNAYASLKSFVEDGRFRVIASGSLLGLIYRKTESNPVGYVKKKELHPLDFEEFLWANGINEETTEKIKQHISNKKPFDKEAMKSLDGLFSVYMIVGGMPEVVCRHLETRDVVQIREVQSKILEGYRDDVTKYADVKEYDKILSCMDSIPSQLSKDSKKFSYKLIDSEFVPTFKTYESSINWMSDASIIELCKNISSPAEPLEERVIDNRFKAYMRDTGLLVCMLGINTAKAVMSDDRRVNKGAVMENIVAQCLSANGFPLRYFGKDNLEIDFIVELSSVITAIEVKSGNNKQSKSLDSMKNNYKVKRLIKFEKTDIYIDEKGIEHYPLFACAFINELHKEPIINLNIDSSSLSKMTD